MTRADWAAAWALFPGGVAYVWHAALRSTTVAQILTKEGFTIRAQIIWAKERLVIGRGDYQWQHEPCWYAVCAIPATGEDRSTGYRLMPDTMRWPE
jgi:DNA modification methylase